MPIRLYRFHCTDGHDLVADRIGRRLANVAQMRVHADRVALKLMERVAQRFDWASWQVDVYDAKGRRVWVTAFVDVDADLEAA